MLLLMLLLIIFIIVSSLKLLFNKYFSIFFHYSNSSFNISKYDSRYFHLIYDTSFLFIFIISNISCFPLILMIYILFVYLVNPESIKYKIIFYFKSNNRYISRIILKTNLNILFSLSTINNILSYKSVSDKN